MTITIISGQHPPNIADIDAVFHVKDKKGIIYAYGDNIYNPDGITLSDHIYTHEVVHCVRQSDTLASAWWDKYLKVPSFRLAEEVVAHRAEWGQFVKDNKDKNTQARYLHFMCQRLSGPLYGNLLTVAEAKQRILGS